MSAAWQYDELSGGQAHIKRDKAAKYTQPMRLNEPVKENRLQYYTLKSESSLDRSIQSPAVFLRM